MASLTLNARPRYLAAANSTWSGSANAAIGLLLFSVPIAIALYHDIYRFYLTTVDADFIFIYEALRKNAGLEQRMNDHTGYTYYVLLAWTLKIAKLLGLISVQALNELPPLDSPDFERVYAPLVYAGRYCSAILSGLFAILVFQGLRLVTGNLVVSLCGGLLVATGADLTAQALMLYPELLSMFLIYAGFMATVAAARRSGLPAAAWLCAAPAFVVLGVMTKLHGVLVALGVPLLVLMLEWHGGNRRTPRPVIDRDVAILIVLSAAAFILPAFLMAGTSIAAWSFVGPSMSNRQPNGSYQLLILTYLVVAVVAFSLHRRLTLREAAVAIAVLCAGLAAGLYGHLLYHSVATTTVFVNFVEQLYHMGSVYRHTGGSALAGDSWAVFVEIAFRGIGRALDRRFMLRGLGFDPVKLLNWLTVLALVAAVPCRAWRPAFQAIAFLGLGIAAEGSFSLYSIHIKHLIYIEVWTIMALGVLAADLLPRLPRAAQAIAAAAAFSVILLQGSDALDKKHIAHFPLQDICGQSEAYTPEIAPAFRKYCAR